MSNADVLTLQILLILWGVSDNSETNTEDRGQRKLPPSEKSLRNKTATRYEIQTFPMISIKESYSRLVKFLNELLELL